MSKTLLCHISTPAALKCISVMELTKPQNVALFYWVFFSLSSMVSPLEKSVKVIHEVIQQIVFFTEVAITLLN